MSNYFEDTEAYLTGTFETYLGLRTCNENVALEDFSDLQRFLNQEGVSYESSQDLNFPPSETEDLGELIRFVEETGVV